MSLHDLASGVISAINPPDIGTIKVSNGTYTKAPDGTRKPGYTVVDNVELQVQALSYSDILMTASLNIQGERRAIYVRGKIDGLVRPANKGGDLIIIREGANAGVWLVATVLEYWADWCKLAVTLQNNPIT